MQIELDLDEAALASAAVVLGTESKSETINAALAVIASGSARRELMVEIDTALRKIDQRQKGLFDRRSDS